MTKQARRRRGVSSERRKKSRTKNRSSDSGPRVIRTRFQLREGKTNYGSLKLNRVELGDAERESSPGFAAIELHQDPYLGIFKDRGYTPDEIPQTIQVHYMNPGILESVDRTSCLILLKHLSGTSVKIAINITEGDRKPKLITGKKGADVDLAALLILSISLRENSTAFAGELVGLAPLTTVEALRSFYRRPFLDSSAIFALTHGAARHISQKRNRNGGQRGDYALFKTMSSVIALLLQWPDEALKNDPVKWFFDAITAVFRHWSGDSDRGLQIGLLLVGEEKFLQGALAKRETKLDLGVTILKSIHGAVSGAPVAGFVAAVIEPWSERAALALKEGQLAEYKAAWCQVWQTYRHNFRNDIVQFGGVFMDGDFVKARRECLDYVDMVMDDEKPLRAF